MKRTLPLLILFILTIVTLVSCNTTYEVQEPYVIRLPGLDEKKPEETTPTVEKAETPAVVETVHPTPIVPTAPETPVVPETPVEAEPEEPKAVEPTVTPSAETAVPVQEPVAVIEEIEVVETETIPVPAPKPEAKPLEMEEVPGPSNVPATEVTKGPEEAKEPVLFTPVDFDDVTTAFNYAYGMDAMNQLRADGISFIGSYFARGVFDACSERYNPTLLSLTELQPAIDDYVAEYLVTGETFEAGERPETIDGILALETPEDIPSRFSYAYAFATVVDLLESEVDIHPSEFTTGALDVLYGVDTLSQNEIQTLVNNYILYLNEQYYEEQANLNRSNQEKAALFFEANGKREEVRTLADGMQLEILAEDEYLGDYPKDYDTVVIDYNLYVLNFDTEELEMIDADWEKRLTLETTSYPLKESILNMRVGQAQRSFIPPQLTIDDGNDYEIEPNTVLVYDIALNGIVN